MADTDRNNRIDVRFERLAVLGQTSDGLASQLRVMSTSATPESAIYLDALDEVMVPVKVAGLIIERWIRDELIKSRPRLRISCRSAVWPAGVAAAIQEVYGEDECAIAMLQPFSLEDVERIVADYGLNFTRFKQAVEIAGANILLRQPLTLKMMLRLFAQRDSLPTSRIELFAHGVEELATERNERLEGGTTGDFSAAEILEASERLACYLLLSGREKIDLSDLPPTSSLGRIELAALQGTPRLDDKLLRSVGMSGLYDSDESQEFRFAHRQFAEYLAGRRLSKLLPHQSRALLSSGAGWREGVAGPLRETAAFAAIQSGELAAWVAEYDPEVIGLSDVADNALRKRATAKLLDKFRRHELTDIQLIRGESIELAGFQYPEAETDLRPVLKDRQPGCEDVLECVIKLIQTWRLESMSDDLADLMLDATAPIESRKAAGYALFEIGPSAVRKRLQPLISGDAKDVGLDLKGLALRCTWPNDITTDELLSAVSTPANSSYGGAYQGFLFHLELSGFSAEGSRLEGLRWALKFINRDSDIEHQGRIARQIAIASVDEIDQPGIGDALVDVLLTAAKIHAGSPLHLPTRPIPEEDETELDANLQYKPAARRKLVDIITARNVSDSTLWWIAHEIQYLVTSDDFVWLLECAVSPAIPMKQRERYAELARTVQWQDIAENVEAWLASRATEPIASRFPFPISVALDSDEAKNAKRAYEQLIKTERPAKRKKLSPPPHERVKDALEACETKNPRFFINLTQELTLEEYSTHYKLSRFLIATPGWSAAELSTRLRIVHAAKAFLTGETSEPERCRALPLNSILIGYMPALWLVMDQDPGWLDTLATQWWERWCWYIVRELHPGLHGEQSHNDFKIKLAELLHRRAPEKFNTVLTELITSGSADLGSVKPLLDAVQTIVAPDLDDALKDKLINGTIPEERTRDVATFILDRDSGRSVDAFASCLEPEAASRAEGVAVSTAVVLLQHQPGKSWPIVREFLKRRPDLASRVLAKYADGEYFGVRANDKRFVEFDCIQVGELVSTLLSSFPPESDQPRNGFRDTSPNDSAIRLRNQLISWLGDQQDIKAVEALRSLEKRFGDKYDWLRRPRARAEQSCRRTLWAPIPPKSTAEILAAASKRLIRSGQDAVDGLVSAIEQYAYRLQHDSPNDLDDFWNRPRKSSPTPKDEERASEKLCAAIRDYFRDYAVTADREVEVFRRKLSAKAGGAPGSEVDVLCRVPAAGLVDISDPIVVPVEVKLSHNESVRTALANQLVDRYMSELGTDFGVFVVVWMDRVSPRSRFRPAWPTLSEAESELEKQAAEVSATRDSFYIKSIIVDASLPKTGAKKPASQKRQGKQVKNDKKRKLTPTKSIDPTVEKMSDKQPKKAHSRKRGSTD